MIRARFELQPHGCAELVAATVSSGMAGNRRYGGASVVSEGDGEAVIDFPCGYFGFNPALLMCGLVGEAMELGVVSHYRLIGVEVPDGFLPGPSYEASTGAEVGLIVKPSVGLVPEEVAAVVAEAVDAGVRFVKDDEMHASPPWCPLEERVSAVARALEPGVVYCANVTGAGETLIDRARRVVDLGATGVLVNAFAQGLGGLLDLRLAHLGVPVFAHRAGSGAWVRNDHFGMTGAVVTTLSRLCGADYVIVGGFSAKLFETPDEVHANIDAARRPLGTVRRSTAVLGGGIGPGDVSSQVDQAGGSGLLVLMGSAAYTESGGVGAAVRRAREALSR